MTDSIVLTGVAAPKSYIDKQIAKGEVDYSAYTDAADAPVTEDTLSMLRRLAQEQMDAERRVEALTTQLKNAVAEYEAICGGEFTVGKLPTIMEHHGLPDFEFIDGVTGDRLKITYHDKLKVALPTMQVGKKMVKDPVKCKIVYDWFRSIGLAGIIDKELIVPVGLESDEVVLKLAALIKESAPDLEVAVSEEIHHSRLASQVKQRVDAGKSVHELLRVTPVKVSTAKLK